MWLVDEGESREWKVGWLTKEKTKKRCDFLGLGGHEKPAKPDDVAEMGGIFSPGLKSKCLLLDPLVVSALLPILVFRRARPQFPS